MAQKPDHLIENKHEDRKLAKHEFLLNWRRSFKIGIYYQFQPMPLWIMRNNLFHIIFYLQEDFIDEELNGDVSSYLLLYSINTMP